MHDNKCFELGFKIDWFMGILDVNFEKITHMCFLGINWKFVMEVPLQSHQH
jgi:hypothetical protein